MFGLNTTWYSVAIKKPNTKEYLYWNSYDYPHKTQFLQGTDIDLWLQLQRGRTLQKWTHWAVYNDQLPHYIKECGFLKGINNSGHCKGVVMWNNEKVGWLIHSIPKFPSTFNNFTIDAAELKFAQSMIYIELPVKYKLQVMNQLAMMDAQLYEFNGDDCIIPLTLLKTPRSDCITENVVIDMFKNTIMKRKATDVIQLPLWGVSAYHCAKNRNYCRDFYETIACLRKVTTLADGDIRPSPNHFGARERSMKLTDNKIPILCETWTNGEGQRLGDCETVRNIIGFSTWKSTVDHSKWAIEWSDTSNKVSWFCCCNAPKPLYRVCIGDLNHMSSQMVRGGGGIIIDGNKALWQCFMSECVRIVPT